MDETARIDRESIIWDTLAEIVELLDRAHACAEVRELRAQAERLRRVVAHWSVVRPERHQVGAMHELVSTLHDEASRFAHAVSGLVLPHERPTLREVPIARAR